MKDRIHRAGGEVIALSTDDDQRQAGMCHRWPTPNVWYASDPDGASFLRANGLYNPDERDGIALPALIVIDPDGGEVYRYVGRDFADRTTDDDMLAALEGLGLDPIEPPAGGPVAPVAPELTGFFDPAMFVPYFAGNRFGAVAIGGRTDDRELRAIVREHRKMVEATLEAWGTLHR